MAPQPPSRRAQSKERTGVISRHVCRHSQSTVVETAGEIRSQSNPMTCPLRHAHWAPEVAGAPLLVGRRQYCWRLVGARLAGRPPLLKPVRALCGSRCPFSAGRPCLAAPVGPPQSLASCREPPPVQQHSQHVQSLLAQPRLESLWWHCEGSDPRSRLIHDAACACRPHEHIHNASRPLASHRLPYQLPCTHLRLRIERDGGDALAHQLPG